MIDDAAMLETVLDHRLEDHRRNLVRGILNLDIKADIRFLFHTDALEVYVIADISNLLLQRYQIRSAVIGHISEHLAELHDRIWRLFVLDQREGVYTVEGIEEKVRINLSTEVFQFEHCAMFALQAVESLALVQQP